MLVDLRDVTHSLAQADSDVKVAAYAELGISVTCHAYGGHRWSPGAQIDHVAGVGVAGVLDPLRTRIGLA